MFKKYRILEVDGKFIPQVKICVFDFFGWVGIDLNNGGECYVLSEQIDYCSKKTIEEARLVIDIFIEKKNRQTKIQEY